MADVGDDIGGEGSVPTKALPAWFEVNGLGH